MLLDIEEVISNLCHCLKVSIKTLCGMRAPALPELSNRAFNNVCLHATREREEIRREFIRIN